MPQNTKTSNIIKVAGRACLMALGFVEHPVLGVKDSTKPFSILQYILFIVICTWAVVRVQTMVNYTNLAMFVVIFLLAGCILYSALLLLYATVRKLVMVNRSFIIANVLIFTLFILLVADTLNQAFPIARQEPVYGRVYEMKADQDDWLHWVYIKTGNKDYRISLHRYRYNKVSVGDLTGVQTRTGLLGFDYVIFLGRVR